MCSNCHQDKSQPNLIKPGLTKSCQGPLQLTFLTLPSLFTQADYRVADTISTSRWPLTPIALRVKTKTHTLVYKPWAGGDSANLKDPANCSPPPNSTSSGFLRHVPSPAFRAGALLLWSPMCSTLFHSLPHLCSSYSSGHPPLVFQSQPPCGYCFMMFDP